MTSTLAPEALSVDPKTLTFSDSCDSCGYSDGGKGERISQAFVLVVLPSGSRLTLCKHHGEKHAPALAKSGAEIVDTSERINTKPSVSANV